MPDRNLHIQNEIIDAEIGYLNYFFLSLAIGLRKAENVKMQIIIPGKCITVIRDIFFKIIALMQCLVPL